MTYLAWQQGTVGTFFFGHSERLRDQPPNLIAECQRLGLESQELTPAILGTDVPVKSSHASVHAVARLEQRRGGGIVVLVANPTNEPRQITLDLGPDAVVDGAASVLFVGRNLTVKAGALSDWIDALGTRAYRLRPKKAWRAASEPPAPALDPANVLGNPSFEDGANLFPDGFWTMVGNDTGTCSSSFSSSSEV